MYADCLPNMPATHKVHLTDSSGFRQMYSLPHRDRWNLLSHQVTQSDDTGPTSPSTDTSDVRHLAWEPPELQSKSLVQLSHRRRGGGGEGGGGEREEVGWWGRGAVLESLALQAKPWATEAVTVMHRKTKPSVYRAGNSAEFAQYEMS